MSAFSFCEGKGWNFSFLQFQRLEQCLTPNSPELILAEWINAASLPAQLTPNVNQCYMSPFPWRNTVAGPNDINTNKIMSLGLQSYFHPFNLFLFAFTLWLNQLFQTFIILLTSPIQPWSFEILATTFIFHIIKKIKVIRWMRSHNLCSITCIVYPHLFLYSLLLPQTMSCSFILVPGQPFYLCTWL